MLSHPLYGCNCLEGNLMKLENLDNANKAYFNNKPFCLCVASAECRKVNKLSYNQCNIHISSILTNVNDSRLKPCLISWVSL